VRQNLQKWPRLWTAKPELWMLLAIVVASVVLRVALLRTDRIVRWDEPDYLILGKHLFTGQGYTVSGRPELHYAPLFPIVTGLLYPLTHDMKLNSDLAYVLFGTLTLLPFYWLARRLFGLRIAWMATAFLCLFPALTAGVLFWGTMLEPLYLCLLFTGLCAIWAAWEEGSLRAYLAAGISFGLAYLTKPEAVVDFGCMLCLLALGNLARHRRAVRTPHTRGRVTKGTLAGLVTAAVAFALVISPYIFFVYRYTGRIMISGKLGVTYVAGQGAVEHDPGLYDRALSRLDEAGEEIIWFSQDRFKYQVWDYIKADPPAFLRRIWQNANTLESVLFTRQVFPFYLLALVSLGWFAAPWDRRRAVKEGFLLTAALPVLIFLPFHIELRYFAPALPILVLWVAKGIAALADWLQATWASLRLRGPAARVGTALGSVLFVLLVLYFLVLQPLVLRDGLAGMNPSHREAGLWLKAHTSPEAMIMSRDTEVPFYAERRWAATPNEEYPRFIEYIRKRGAQYIVIDEREAKVIRPQLAFLLDADSPPPELKHVYTANDPQGSTIVYEVSY
jgi:4-amino-4-deoxy-L-arabinose transferase-like glycosyltransferase